ncbi:MAG: AsmA-like C-terminal region-containing protein, partial [Chitinophagales bacterium]
FSTELRAHVNFSDADISLFRHFPKISVGLNNLQVICVGAFEGDTLLVAKQIDIALNFKSLLSGDSIKINSITINEPRIHAQRRKDGLSNWDIIESEKSLKEPGEIPSKPLSLAIQQYTIHKGWLEYQDEIKHVHIHIANMEHEGSGNFGADIFRLKTKTSAEAVHFSYGGSIPYELTAKTSLELTLRVEKKFHIYSFNTDQVFFNDLKLHTEGFFQWINDSSYNMNIKFNAPSTEFRNILSVLPSLYQKNFANIKSDGKADLNGIIKGKYDDKHFPGYHVNLDVENGFFRYPDLPTPVEHINLALHLDNPDGADDHLTVNIPKGHLEINHDTVDFHLSVRNPKTKPFLDLAFVGKIDFANIAKLTKSDSLTKLSGVLNADVHANGIIPGIEKRRKDQFQARGRLGMDDFNLVSSSYPRGISINHLAMTFNSKNVLINELKGEYRSSHIQATGSLENLFAFAIENKPLTASINVKADDINLKDWMTTFKRSDNPSGQEQPGAHFIVPGNIDFTITAGVEKLHYDNLDMQNLSCMMLISDETIYLDHVKADALDGTMIINGTYSTWESREYPEIALNYNVTGLDVQKTFFAFNTLRNVMPVGKFISGKLSSKMSLHGSLGDNMSPNMQSLHGEGNISVTDGLIKDFGPLDKLSESLDILELKNIPLKDVKADFSFKAGKVVVEPFYVHGKDFDLEVGGSHGFDQSLDYDLGLKVQRKQLGKKGSEFVKNIVNQAADKGIPVNLKDAVGINVKVGGTINNPDVKTDMNAVVDNASAELNKEVSAFVNAKLDSARQQLHNPKTSGKQLVAQTSNKSKKHSQTKTRSGSTSKSSAHLSSKKKQKNAKKYYSTGLKKTKSVASK